MSLPHLLGLTRSRLTVTVILGSGSWWEFFRFISWHIIQPKNWAAVFVTIYWHGCKLALETKIQCCVSITLAFEFSASLVWASDSCETYQQVPDFWVGILHTFIWQDFWCPIDRVRQCVSSSKIFSLQKAQSSLTWRFISLVAAYQIRLQGKVFSSSRKLSFP